MDYLGTTSLLWKFYNINVCDLWSRHQYQIWEFRKIIKWATWWKFFGTEVGRVAHLMNGSDVLIRLQSRFDSIIYESWWWYLVIVKSKSYFWGKAIGIQSVACAWIDTIHNHWQLMFIKREFVALSFTLLVEIISSLMNRKNMYF